MKDSRGRIAELKFQLDVIKDRRKFQEEFIVDMKKQSRQLIFLGFLVVSVICFMSYNDLNSLHVLSICIGTNSLMSEIRVCIIDIPAKERELTTMDLEIKYITAQINALKDLVSDK